MNLNQDFMIDHGDGFGFFWVGEGRLFILDTSPDQKHRNF